MRRLPAGIALAVAFALCGVAHAAVPGVDARAFTVVDVSRGAVLASHAAHARLPVASITKLMTAIVALRHLRAGATVTVSAQALGAGGARIPLRAGQRIPVRELLEAALIASANDAADALAAAAAGGDLARFVGWMNARAREFGLHDTHFARPDGLDAPGHVSSAHDVVLLAEAAMGLPVVRAIVRERTATIERGAVVLHTWNDLLGAVPGVVGVKTGFTAAAGWCEVVAARRGGRTIYAVVLGSPTRARRNGDLERLLAWAFSRPRALTAARTGHHVAGPP